MRVGAIDVGSNSVRLLVADVRSGTEDGELVTIARAGEACRLGRGLEGAGEIDGGTAERAAVVAGEFARRARSLGAVHTIVGATAALRQADNGAAVAAAIEQRTGLPVRILSGEAEARLVYRAVVLGLRGVARRSPCVVFDLGGGSTEVVSGMGPEAGRWASLPFGAVSLTERFVRSEPAGVAEVSSLMDAVRCQLMHDCALMPEKTPMLAGVGGTVTALAALDKQMTVYDPTSIEGWLIESSRLEGLVERIAASTEKGRRGWAVIGQGRSDILVAGALTVRLIAQRFPSRGLVCSTQGLRYGLVRLAAAEAARHPHRDRAGLHEPPAS